MINRSLHMIFEPSGMPVPSEEEVRFEAREIVQRSGWGLPLIEALRKVQDPYWREAVTRCLMDQWHELVRDKNEQTYFYDMDGDIRFCWADIPAPSPMKGKELARKAHAQIIYNITIEQNNGPIITDSNVSIH